MKFQAIVLSFLPLALVLAQVASAQKSGTNLTRLGGVAYQFVDAENAPIEGQYKDARGALTDGKARLQPVSASPGRGGAMRVLFDFGATITPLQMSASLSTDKAAGADRIEVYAGDSLETLKRVASHEVGALENRWCEVEVPLEGTPARLLRVDFKQRSDSAYRGIRVAEVEVFGSKEDAAKVKSSGGAAMESAAAMVRRSAALSAMQKGDPLAALTAGLQGVALIQSSWSEKQVRQAIGAGEPGDVFFIEPRSSWVLKQTLEIPEGVSLLATNPGGGKGGEPTFIKGFDGPLATLARFTTLHGLHFDGNKAQFAGDGIVAGGHTTEGVREVRMVRVAIRNNRGNGYVMSVPHYYSWFQFCSFDHNDGYGIMYGEVRSHHTDNMWDSCHYGWNGKGGVAFHGVEASSVWENCEWFHNGGPAFDHFLINRKLSDGKPVGPRPESGAGALVVRNSVIRQCAGPVWLNRGGVCESIVFEDSRLKHNGNPANSAPTKDLGKSVQDLFGLAEGPVGGLFHVEKGRLFVELRGGFAWDNGAYFFTTGPNSNPGSRLVVSGAAKTGHITGGIHAPNAYVTLLDRSLLSREVPINVQSGIALDPVRGKVVKLGTGPGPKVADP